MEDYDSQRLQGLQKYVHDKKQSGLSMGESREARLRADSKSQKTNELQANKSFSAASGASKKSAQKSGPKSNQSRSPQKSKETLHKQATYHFSERSKSEEKPIDEPVMNKFTLQQFKEIKAKCVVLNCGNDFYVTSEV